MLGCYIYAQKEQVTLQRNLEPVHMQMYLSVLQKYSLKIKFRLISGRKNERKFITYAYSKMTKYLVI